MKTLPCHNHKQQAYTLIEIMLVLAIISVLLGAGIYALVGNLDTGREVRVKADIAAIVTQLRTYEAQNLILPSNEQGLSALVSKPTTEPIPRRWRQLYEKLPTDPWGNTYQYRYPGKRNPQSFDIYSFGPDRKESDDDLGNWE